MKKCEKSFFLLKVWNNEFQKHLIPEYYLIIFLYFIKFWIQNWLISSKNILLKTKYDLCIVSRIVFFLCLDSLTNIKIIIFSSSQRYKQEQGQIHWIYDLNLSILYYEFKIANNEIRILLKVNILIMTMSSEQRCVKANSFLTTNIIYSYTRLKKERIRQYFLEMKITKICYSSVARKNTNCCVLCFFSIQVFVNFHRENSTITN